MAKKKQFAGKETKLAKLPLTQVLANQGDETAPGGPTWAPPTSAGPMAYLSPQPGEPAAGPLTAAYLYLIQELTTLRSRLLPSASLSWLTPQPALPRGLTDRRRLAQALRQAREGLQDLHRLLGRV
jgi:hypothetical protein